MKQNLLNENNSQVIWEGESFGLIDRFLSFFHLNSSIYQITNDELIIKEGFFKRKTTTIRLCMLKEPNLIETLFQRLLNIGSIYLKVDTNLYPESIVKIIEIKNIKNPEILRKLLKDLIINLNKETKGLEAKQETIII